MDVVINTQFLRSECDNILQGFSIGSAADYHWLVFGVTGYIHVCFVQCIDKRRLSWEKQRIADCSDLNASVLVFQSALAHFAHLVCL